MFCSIRVALSNAYLRDVTPGGYGGTGGKYGIVLPVSSRSGPLTLKHRRATRGGEINSFYSRQPCVIGGLHEVLLLYHRKGGHLIHTM